MVILSFLLIFLSTWAEAGPRFSVGLGYAPSPHFNAVPDATHSEDFRMSRFQVGADASIQTSVGIVGIGLGIGGGKTNQLQRGVNVSSVSLIPTQLFGVYRGKYWDLQLLVPFVKAGTSYGHRQETVDADPNASQTAIYRGMDLSSGIEIDMGFIDRAGAKQMKRSLGIVASSITIEFVKSSPLGDSPDFLSREEWRFGLNFAF